jgi:hypothetical protein
VRTRFLPAPSLTAAAAAAAALLLLAACPPVLAGTIGFRTDAEVKAGPGVDAKITLTHTGDEAASEVSVHAELDRTQVDGETVSQIMPNESHVWNIHLTDAIPNGIYVITLRVRYTDSNGYPFEIVSIANANVGVAPAPRIFGNIDLPGLTTSGEAVAKLTAKKPPGRTGKVDVRLVAPAGIEVRPGQVSLEFDAGGKAEAIFHVRNLKLLAGTSVNVFGYVTASDAGFPQTDVIHGAVKIGTAIPKIKAPTFYELGGVLMALLAVLEAVVWFRSRSRAEEQAT